MSMRSRLLVIPPLLLGALALGVHPQSSFAAGPPVQPSFGLRAAGAGLPDYQVDSEQYTCTDSSCTTGTDNGVYVAQFSTAAFGVPDEVYAFCESWSGSTYTYEEGAGVSPRYPYYYPGSSTAGVGGATGSSMSTSAPGYAFAASGTPGSVLSSYDYGHVSVTGVDVANNVTGKMTSGSFTVSISNGTVYTNSGTHTGSMACTVRPGNYYNYAYNTANASGGF